MSSRNPMNERYTLDKKGGKSRKSAASSRPKSKAASSVVKGSKKKTMTRQEKRAKKKELRDKEYQAERKYGDPPTKRFKRLKRLWIGFLIGSIGMVCLSFAASKVDGAPQWLALMFLGLAYACIIVTLYLDLGKIRKERKAYAARMAASQAKEVRAAEKKRKAALREQAKKQAEDEKNKTDNSEKYGVDIITDKIRNFHPFKKKKK